MVTKGCMSLLLLCFVTLAPGRLFNPICFNSVHPQILSAQSSVCCFVHLLFLYSFLCWIFQFVKEIFLWRRYCSSEIRIPSSDCSTQCPLLLNKSFLSIMRRYTEYVVIHVTLCINTVYVYLYCSKYFLHILTQLLF